MAPRVPETVPPPSGAELLDQVRDAVRRYCFLPSQEALDAVTLWIVTTHCLPAFDFAPRLVIRSAEKRSGKSRLLEIIHDLCFNPLLTVNTRAPAIFRSLEEEHPPTLLFDEVDTMFGSRQVAEQNEELRGLINAGFHKGQFVLRTTGPLHTPTKFPTFAMAALAGIGRLPDTIEDRAVVVVMKRRTSGEHVKQYRLRLDRPILRQIGDQLTAWADGAGAELESALPDLPVEDRAADTWEPLIAVADAAGDHWPDTARAACKRLTDEASDTQDDGSLNVRLLADIQELFIRLGQDFVNTAMMVNDLNDIADAPWSDMSLSANKLSRRLREFGIRPSRNPAGTLRGYKREDFSDAFNRYLAGTGDEVSEPSDLLESQAGPSDGSPSTDTSNRQ
jgi:hypothetical protein